MRFESTADSRSETAPKTDIERRSYSIGVDIGNSLKGQGVDLSLEFLNQGLNHSYKGHQLLVSTDDIHKEIQRVQDTIMEKQLANVKQKAEDNLAKGERFLSENQSNENVVTLPSGLQYEVVSEGTGAKPKPTDKVKVHYRGTSIDGKEFDSSYSRNEPSVFPVNAVIPGWTEALTLMSTGSKWRIVVPSNLAYGEFGAGNVIGPNETLVFDIELLSIVN
ncbi:MAG: hypothetical protein CMF48_05790 [Legionellales bacterium]|nr:hypothetical protein [Legionellales bacterium]